VERPNNLFGLDREALRSLFAGLGEPAYRAQQAYSWLYEKRAASVEQMTDLPKALRERLAATHEVRWPRVTERAVSHDGTVKYLFTLDDGATIESVFIPEERRRTICISTQAGWRWCSAAPGTRWTSSPRLSTRTDIAPRRCTGRCRRSSATG
jgi:23S rRNA (adenine2503-C2)-methyltransferase